MTGPQHTSSDLLGLPGCPEKGGKFASAQNTSKVLWHSDILKDIMVHCTSLFFARAYSHVKAHRDDNEEFKNLPRPAQLNVHHYSMDKHEI